MEVEERKEAKIKVLEKFKKKSEVTENVEKSIG